MNTATGNLENDHVYILQLTAVMENITRLETPNTEHIARIIDIIRNFADGIHHAKEENHLFKELGKKGLSPYQGPVAVMLHEHQEGRNYVKGMDENLALYLKGEKGALKELYKNMIGYASLLQNHISKENNILFRMADNLLSSADQAALLSKFEAEENIAGNGKKSSDYITRVLELSSFYRVE